MLNKKAIAAFAAGATLLAGFAAAPAYAGIFDGVQLNSDGTFGVAAPAPAPKKATEVELAKATLAVAEAKEAYAAAFKKQGEAQKKFNEAAKKFDEAEAKFKGAEKEWLDTVALEAAAKAELETAKKENPVDNAKVEQLQKNVDALTAKVASAVTAKNEADGAKKTAETAKNKAAAELVEARKAVSAAEEALNTAKDKLAKLEATLGNAKQDKKQDKKQDGKKVVESKGVQTAANSSKTLAKTGAGVALTALAASVLAGMGAAVRKFRH